MFVSRVRDEKMDVNRSIQRQLEEVGRSWSRDRRTAPVLGASRTECASDRVTAYHFNQRPTAASSNRGECGGGHTIASRMARPFWIKRAKTSLRPIMYQPSGQLEWSKSGNIGRWGIENQGFRSLSPDLGCSISGRAQLRSGVVAVGIVHDLQRTPPVRATDGIDPDYAEELRQMRRYGPGQPGGSHDHRSDGFRVLLCVVVAGDAGVAKATTGQDDAAGMKEEIAQGGDRELE